VRRKADSACFNPEMVERTVLQENCACTPEDFECDYAFERQQRINPQTGETSFDGECVPVSAPKIQDPDYNAPCEDYKRKSKGYRRVAGDSCTGGVEEKFDAELVSCSYFTAATAGKIVTFILVLVALSMCVITFGNKFELFDGLTTRVRSYFSTYMILGKHAHPPSAHDDDPTFHLDEDEFNQSAQLVGDGLKRRESRHPETSLQPLPAAPPATAPVPVLAPPPV